MTRPTSLTNGHTSFNGQHNGNSSSGGGSNKQQASNGEQTLEYLSLIWIKLKFNNKQQASNIYYSFRLNESKQKIKRAQQAASKQWWKIPFENCLFIIYHLRYFNYS